MNTNTAGIRWFSKIFLSLCFGQGSLSIGRVKILYKLPAVGIRLWVRGIILRYAIAITLSDALTAK